jgi:acetyltransferase-like isoleucine patch superfamily enzyme
MNKIYKACNVLERWIIKKLMYINVDIYMKCYTKYLIKIGININGTPKYICQDVYFDGNDYSKISIGDNVTISREVMFLTHDYSLTTAYASLGKKINRHEGEIYLSEKITIGDNCFIGARVSILPGSQIGNNVIVGACSVVKGIIPDDSIVIGNPCKIITSTTKWAEKKINSKTYLVEQ